MSESPSSPLTLSLKFTLSVVEGKGMSGGQNKHPVILVYDTGTHPPPLAPFDGTRVSSA